MEGPSTSPLFYINVITAKWKLHSYQCSGSTMTWPATWTFTASPWTSSTVRSSLSRLGSPTDRWGQKFLTWIWHYNFDMTFMSLMLYSVIFRSRWSGWELTRTMWTATSPWPSSPSTCSWWTATPPTTTRLPTPASSCGCAYTLGVSSFPDYTLKQFSSHKHLQDLTVFG